MTSPGRAEIKTGDRSGPQIPLGVLPVLSTPFNVDRSIDVASLEREIDFIMGHRASGVVIGMVSEVLRLSSEERDAVTESVCAAVDGRGSVVASVGAESLHTAVRHAQRAQAAGATALMAIPPLATSCDDDELFKYFAGIIEAVDVPLVVQDASGYLGRPLTIELQARLFEDYGDRALFKPEAQPIGPRLSQLLDASYGKAKVYEGTGGLELVDSHRRGIIGTMPGPEVPWAIVALWEALEAGDEVRVDKVQGPLCELISLQNSLDSFVSVEKHLLQRQNVIPHTYSRGPVAFELDPTTTRRVDELFDRLVEAVGVQI